MGQRVYFYHPVVELIGDQNVAGGIEFVPLSNGGGAACKQRQGETGPWTYFGGVPLVSASSLRRDGGAVLGANAQMAEAKVGVGAASSRVVTRLSRDCHRFGTGAAGLSAKR
jgi:hypothetical protein